MSQFTNRPNPDVFKTVERITISDLMELQTWEGDNAGRVWVLAIVKGGDVVAHTAVHDRFAALLIREAV